ncbi:MAG: hypothetical protein NTX65_13720 [Ignavibacteriales bacterium]|nr:hypothetical protein [Ignavibacteriales bacterium]
MRTKYLLLVSFLFCLNLAAQQPSVDYSDPEEVAQKFLELYFKGDWFGACKLCACEGSEDQISFMIRKMDEMDNVTDDSKCTFTLDKFELDKDNLSGKYFYTKTCPGDDKPKKNHVDMKKIGDRWLVEYIYKRDKFL